MALRVGLAGRRNGTGDGPKRYVCLSVCLSVCVRHTCVLCSTQGEDPRQGDISGRSSRSRLLVFLLGGATHSEIRSVYEISDEVRHATPGLTHDITHLAMSVFVSVSVSVSVSCAASDRRGVGDHRSA